MKLLLDQNLSALLVELLSDAFPGSTHVREHGLERAEDQSIWEYAKLNGYTIVSKDADFHQLSFLYGHPPKVVWVHLGNCTTDAIVESLMAHREDLADFEADGEAAFLRLS